MKRVLLLLLCGMPVIRAYTWGFYGHRMINYYAVFLLPPEMLVLYKPGILYLTDHAVDPDKRRYILPGEGPRHYIDLDRYGAYPFPALPRNWNEAVKQYTADTLQQHGIVPWWVQTMLFRLTAAFKEKNKEKILKLSADIGHYIADAHVPLHTSSNHNGQKTNQRGIHGFWESRIPELLADKEWDLLTERARYISNPGKFIWDRVLESAAAADSVLQLEKALAGRFPANRKYAYEPRNGTVIRQYSEAYTIRYNTLLRGMVERRMRMSIYAVASFWYTAWVNAGQPDLSAVAAQAFNPADSLHFDSLKLDWKNNPINTREHEH